MPRSIVAVRALATHRSNDYSIPSEYSSIFLSEPKILGGKTAIEAWRSHLRQTGSSVLIAGISARASGHPLRGLSAAVHGKLVTFGVTRGCIAVASPVSSITWLIPP